MKQHNDERRKLVDETKRQPEASKQSDRLGKTRAGEV
jgi:hypothetical protein